MALTDTRFLIYSLPIPVQNPAPPLSSNSLQCQINVSEEKILTPIVVAKQWLSSHDVEPIALYLEPESLCEFSEFKQIDPEEESGAGAVLISDISQAWNYNSLNRALRLLMSEPKPEFVALGMSRYWQSEHGLALDVGPFVKALEFATSTNALVMGKPSTSFFKTAAELLTIEYHEVLMIGDDIISDIDAAQQAGLRAAQVKTGKFREADLQSGIKPDYIIGSIADLPALWTDL